MQTGIYSGVAAMHASERRMEAITANLANAETPAYKRVATAAQAFDLELGGRLQRNVLTNHVTDFRQGGLTRTGRTWDLALSGEGFFAVEGPAGEVYTRKGDFRVDADGNVLTQEGRPLVWEGARGRVDPVGEPPTVDAAGNVRQGVLPVGRLRVVRFQDPGGLGVDGQGYYRAARGQVPALADAEVHQGSLERSNTSSVDELVELIQVQRAFESANQLLQSLDQSYRRLTRAG